MAFTEDLSVFFDAAGFGLAATWGAYSATVLLDAPTEDVLGGRVSSDEYQATLPYASLPGIARGAAITIAGVAYTVREVDRLDDGAIKRLRLTKT